MTLVPSLIVMTFKGKYKICPIRNFLCTPFKLCNFCFAQVAEKDFGTDIGGPWMAQWPITHPNRHTALLPESMRTLTKEPQTIY